ncbi:MAG: UDP-N-acetylmuramoyl-tripeptide--D-alanyl-D-alanine ligase [Planctomycetes bacterium]|nr:UDP-N-acetylmuramoyl-tripeptide--D-alanyl-D-alanine ligase [Planctomycetota bacterium]
MHEMTIRDARLAVGGEWLRRPDDDAGHESSDSARSLPVKYGAVCTDTRRLVPGDMFVALKGARFDGSAFLQQAQDAGACALVTASVPEGFQPRVPVIVVPDALVALGRLARAHRDRQKGCVVAVGGSNGKTTTRELTAAVLRSRFQVLQNEANENNRVGVPQTLLRMNALHDFAVIEVGTSEPGEIAALGAVAGPNCAILTSISEEHLEGLGNLDGVLKEESDLLAALPQDGIAIVNFDDPRCVKAAQRARCRVVSYGTDRRCEIRAEDIRTNRHGTHFRLNERHEFRLPLHGLHNVNNALAAIATGWVSGIEVGEMQVALRRVLPVPHRLEFVDCAGIGVLDDSYNANPASMVGALRTLSAFECAGQRIAVLGDMLELGAHAEALHREVAAAASVLNLDLVLAVGPLMAHAAEALEEHFYQRGHGTVWRVADADTAAAALLAEAQPGDTVLVKGSHGMRMERVIAALREAHGAPEGPVCRPTLRERPVGDPLPAVLLSALSHPAA